MPRPYFNKLVLNSTIKDRRLRVPDNFLKKFKDELSPLVRLHVPDGHIWNVGVGQADNKCWLQDGWQDFVEHYAIGIGYFLVFRYEGNSIFSVYIYNLTNSEINYHPSAPRNYNTVGGQQYQSDRQYHVFNDMEDDEDSADALDSLKKKKVSASAISMDHHQLTLSRSTFNSETLQNLFNGNMHPPAKNDVGSQDGIYSSGVKVKSAEDETNIQPQSEGVHKPKKASRKRRKSEPGEVMSLVPRGGEGSTMRFRFYASASTRKRTVTAEERERAVNAAKMFEPSNPFCRVVLRPSYLYRGCIMYLPSCFAEKNLNEVSGIIKLQGAEGGKQWPVRCLYKGGIAKMSQGWYDFTLENKLKEGDVCVFELISSASEEVTLKVTNFRVADDVAP